MGERHSVMDLMVEVVVVMVARAPELADEVTEREKVV